MHSFLKPNGICKVKLEPIGIGKACWVNDIEIIFSRWNIDDFGYWSFLFTDSKTLEFSFKF